MSYDFEGETPTVPRKVTLRARLASWWWGFVLWCALDSGVGVLERWGMRRIEKGGR